MFVNLYYNNACLTKQNIFNFESFNLIKLSTQDLNQGPDALCHEAVSEIIQIKKSCCILKEAQDKSII